MAASDTRPPVSAPRWQRWLLILSLALNLAVAGVVAGSVFSGRHGPPRGFDLSIGPIARALEPEDRRWIMRELAGREGIGRPDPERVAAEFAATRAALRQSPFDPEALREVFAVMQSRGETLQRAAQDALIARITAMSAEDRAGLADRLEHAMAPGERGRP